MRVKENMENRHRREPNNLIPFELISIKGRGRGERTAGLLLFLHTKNSIRPFLSSGTKKTTLLAGAPDGLPEIFS